MNTHSRWMLMAIIVMAFSVGHRASAQQRPLILGASEMGLDGNDCNQQRLDKLLIGRFPELKSEARYFLRYSRSRKYCGDNPPDSCEIRLLVYVERCPDPHGATAFERDYYQIYVGQAHIDHCVRMNTFVAHKSSHAIFHYDMNKDVLTPLTTYRKQYRRSQRANAR